MPKVCLSSQPSLFASFSCVTVLDVLVSPAAISWLVISVIVDAVQRGFWRPFTHVGEEVVECSPAFAKGDSPTSVILKSVSLWIGAALLHSNPRLIGSRKSSLPRMAVPEMVTVPKGSGHD
jgi:hypothetical protein